MKVGPPATADAGERLVSVKGWIIENGSGEGEVCPGAATPTDAVPAEAIKVAGTVALSCPGDRKPVAREDPFQVTTVLVVKPEPSTFNVNAGPPAVALFGEMLVSIRGARIVKVRGAVEVSPFAVTATDAVPAVVIRLAGMAAESWVVDTKVVATEAPFQVTTAPVENPEPLASKVNEGPPAIAVLGEMLVSTSGAITLNATAEGEVCSGEVTSTASTPLVAIKLAGTAADN